MDKLIVGFIILMINLLPARAQVGQNQTASSIRFSGYVRTDFLYDTRQSSASNGLREGHFYLYPDPVLYDADSADINATPTFHILSIQSRIRGDFFGPDILGGKTSGVIEAEFFGTSEADLNGFRLRHGFIQMAWQRSTLILGQTWHPMFPAECFPGTVSFNTGAPFIPFSRNPQLRFTYRLKRLDLTATGYSQRDFTSTGPDGFSSKYIRNSGFPAVNAQAKWSISKSSFVTLGMDFKVIRPELKTSKNVVNPNRLPSFSYFAVYSLKKPKLNLALMGAWVQNASDIMMIGGYGVSEIVDPVSEIRTFANLTTASAWLDVRTTGKTLQAGLYAGYSKNLGASREFAGPVFARGANIDYLARVSPRVIFTKDLFSLSGEFETTVAAYGKTLPDGSVGSASPVTNHRILIAVQLKF